MKSRVLILILGSFFCIFTGCEPVNLSYDSTGGKIYFFQFTDTAFMNKIIVSRADYWDDRNIDDLSKYMKDVGNNLGIPLYPKNIKGESLFGNESSVVGYSLGYCMNGEPYTLDDLVNSPKFIALKGEYYICYPFTSLEVYGQYIDAEWKDLYTINFEQIKLYSKYPYKKRYEIDEYTLTKLTQKSTFNFRQKKSKKITIDDVVETLNMLIETNRIDEYCYEIYIQNN